MACEQEDIYALVQYSDTDFNNNHFLFDYFVTNIDLSDHTAKVDVPAAHFSKDLEIQYDDKEDLFFVTVDFTAEETGKMPLGVTDIIVVVYNSDGKQQSLKRIPIKVLKKGNILPTTQNREEQELVAMPGYAITQIVRTPPYDHDTLRHRDYPDQHPISAITGLEGALGGKVDKTTQANKLYGTDGSGNQTVYDNPTIGNATLTVQRNSTAIGTFTANATVDKSINITVPTTAAEVNALPDTTKYAAGLYLNVSTTDYVMTAQLKDQDGNNIGEARTVDLPLESMVVSGSYDSTNKKIVLTLQSGSTIDIPVGDLVAGLQTEITVDNKLNADLVDDTSTTNKFVTAGDKTTWNGKQDQLVSGTNIKTVNNNSLLGEGNLDIDALPSQSGQNGKYLTTDGESASWATVTVPTKISDLTDDTSSYPVDKADTLTGLTADVSELNILDGVTASTAEINVLDGLTATTEELNYVDGVTSDIQTQLNNKQATITGAASTVTTSDLTPSRLLITDANGKIAASSNITTTEANYLDGVTSNIQTQLDNRVNVKPDGTNDLITNNKVSDTYLPDYVLGQMLYAGGFDPTTATATLTTNAKTKLGTQANTIVLTNDTTAITGYKANEGCYYICTDNGTFAGISLLTGDWLVSTGSAWTKVDNTDAVTGVKGNAESTYRLGNVNITIDNVAPDQTGNSGKVLTTNGTTATWGSLPVADVTVNGTSVVSNGTAAIANMVTTDTAQTITAKKTFQTTTWNGGLTAKRSGTGGSYILFSNTGGDLGVIGVHQNEIPLFIDKNNTDPRAVVRAGVYLSSTGNDASVGDSTTPVYINSNGITQACTMAGYALNPNVVTVSNNATITLTNNTCFRGATLSAFTISVPATFEYPYFCECDFVSGSTATTITYSGSGTITWSPDSDDLVSGIFVPVDNTEYTLMFWYNGTSLCCVARAI